MMILPLSATSKLAEKRDALCGYPLVANISFMRGTKKIAYFNAGVASTPQKHAQGLMFCKNMLDDEALLFIFPYAIQRNFWMKNTSIELAIIFIDSHYNIINIEHGKPQNEKRVYSKRKARFVVEIPWKSSKNLRENDKIIIR